MLSLTQFVSTFSKLWNKISEDVFFIILSFIYIFFCTERIICARKSASLRSSSRSCLIPAWSIHPTLPHRSLITSRRFQTLEDVQFPPMISATVETEKWTYFFSFSKMNDSVKRVQLNETLSSPRILKAAAFPAVASVKDEPFPEFVISVELQTFNHIGANKSATNYNQWLDEFSELIKTIPRKALIQRGQTSDLGSSNSQTVVLCRSPVIQQSPCRVVHLRRSSTRWSLMRINIR